MSVVFALLLVSCSFSVILLSVFFGEGDCLSRAEPLRVPETQQHHPRRGEEEEAEKHDRWMISKICRTLGGSKESPTSRKGHDTITNLDQKNHDTFEQVTTQ